MRPEELRGPTPDEVERLAALDEVELAAGEAEELQPVVAELVAAAAALAVEEPPRRTASLTSTTRSTA